MKGRAGQVALYLVLVLVAITIVAVMNVGVYLSVTAKNRAMNAGDAAALAAAKRQGELLNEIGELNVEHLKLALCIDDYAKLAEGLEQCDALVTQQARLCFLGPLDGIRAGNDAAQANGATTEIEGLRDLLKEHIDEVRMVYATTTDAYPEPWEGAWREYATAFEAAISGTLYAGPDNIDFVDAATGHMLLKREFYDAIAGRNWCWFHFNAEGFLDSYSSFRDWGALPGASDEAVRLRRCQNCEVYSLHLEARAGSAVDLLGTELICRLTGKTAEDVARSFVITNTAQVWYFYDTERSGDGWRTWWEMDPNGDWQFPVVGPVKGEYDVRGAAVVCRVTREVPNVLGSGEDRVARWSAAAKPFGTVENENGATDVVTANKGFVTPAFDAVRLVPIDAVGGRDLATADVEWMRHVRNDLPAYLENGPNALSSCYYCRQLVAWERPSLREQGSRWLKRNSSNCVRPTGGGSGHGGTPHGH
jgi:hypothetical protein